jgi:hypothetical protein
VDGALEQAVTKFRNPLTSLGSHNIIQKCNSAGGNTGTSKLDVVEDLQLIQLNCCQLYGVASVVRKRNSCRREAPYRCISTGLLHMERLHFVWASVVGGSNSIVPESPVQHGQSFFHALFLLLHLIHLLLHLLHLLLHLLLPVY